MQLHLVKLTKFLGTAAKAGLQEYAAGDTILRVPS